MRIPTLAMLALLALAACAPKPAKEYDYPAWNFGAAFPNPPKVTDIPASADGARPHAFRVEMTAGGHDFTVDVTDGSGTSQTDAQVLAAAPQVIADGFSGQLSSQTDVAAGPVAGRELRIDREGQTTLVVRVFAVNHRLYQVAAQSEKGPGDPEAVKFLNSFHLLTK